MSLAQDVHAPVGRYCHDDYRCTGALVNLRGCRD